MGGLGEAIGAALWLGALWLCGRLFAGRGASAADVVRDGLLAGVFLAFVLACVNLLYGAACWLAVGLIAAYALVLHRRRASRDDAEPVSAATILSQRVGFTLPVVAAGALAWPALVRPLLNGDSLEYHLPQAALWVHAHGLWSTLGLAWWYPGGSELFAAALFATSGPFGAGWAGFAALLLLALRLAEWGRRGGLDAWVAGAFAAAAAGVFPLAEQAGNLENDVWLAALFIEILWAGAFARNRIGMVAAACALVKPTGWLYALVALIARRAPRWAALAAFVPFGIWILRDALLAREGTRGTGVSVAWVFESTIAWHGLTGLAVLERALAASGLGTALFFVAGLAAIFIARDGALRLAAAASAILFWFHPFGFADANPQLASGWSLRYAAPLIAVGAVLITELVGRVPRAAARVIGAGALAIAAAETLKVLGIYANDKMTSGAGWVLLATLVVAMLPWRRVRAFALGPLALALVSYAVVLAESHPLDYYDDLLPPSPHASHFFYWLRAHRLPVMFATGIRAGALVAVRPESLAVEADPADPCGDALRHDALLVVGNDDTLPPAWRLAGLALIKRCGRTIYADGVVTVVQPLKR